MLCMIRRESSSSPVEQAMDDAVLAKPQSLVKTRNKKRLKRGKEGEEKDDDDDTEREECDVEAWETLCNSFRQVQTVLDQNLGLIQRVNENHQSKIPDNLAKNVSLLREINGNISKALSIYSELSVSFSNIVQQRRRIPGSKNGKIENTES